MADEIPVTLAAAFVMIFMSPAAPHSRPPNRLVKESASQYAKSPPIQTGRKLCVIDPARMAATVRGDRSRLHT